METSVVGILRMLMQGAFVRVLEVMGTTGLGLFLIPLFAGFIGWWKTKPRRSLKALKKAFSDAFGAVLLAFICVFLYQYYKAFQAFYTPILDIAAPAPIPPPKPQPIPRPHMDSSAQSRIDITDVVGLPLKNPKNDVGFGFSVFYANRGSIPVLAMVRRTVMTLTPTPLTKEQQAAEQKRSLQVPFVAPESINEIQPGDTPRHFFSVPEDDKSIHDFAASIPGVVSGKQRLYLFIAFKYTDAALPAGKVRITEFCGYLIGQVDSWHTCGTNRTYTADR